jgi:hypothetical protein
MTKAARKCAEQILKMWRECVDIVNERRNQWVWVERRQALRDALEAMKKNGLINDYDLDKGIN